MNTTLIAFCLLLLCRLPLAAAQTREGGTVDEAGLSEQEVQQPDGPEEVVVRLSLQGVGDIDVLALQQDTVLLIPVLELFGFLNIHADDAAVSGRITGVYIDAATPYSINAAVMRIEAAGVQYELKETDIIVSNAEIYLNSAVFGRVFGLMLRYDATQMIVHIQSARTLPIQTALQRLRSRALYSETTRTPAEKHLERERRWIAGAMMDWQLNWQRSVTGQHSASLISRGGMEALGGDLSGSISLYSDRDIDWRNMPWRWRYTDDNGAWFRQAIVGWLANDLGLRQSLRGATVNSNWYTLRREFVPHRHSVSAKAGDEIEVYAGTRLIDVIRVERTGAIEIELPMRYGANFYNIKHLSSTGLSSEETVRIDIPSAALPFGELQYKVTAGELQYSRASGMAEGLVSLGLGRHVTVGTGLQALRYRGTEVYPALFSNARVTDNIWLDVSWLHDALTSISATWMTLNSINFRAAVQRLEQHPLYNPGMRRDDYRAGVSLPLTFLRTGSWLSVHAQHQRMHLYDRTNVFSTLTHGMGRVTGQLLTQARWGDSPGSNTVEQELSFLYRAIPGLTLHAGCNYTWSPWQFTVARAAAYYQLTRDVYISATLYAQLQRGWSQLALTMQLRIPEGRLESRASYYGPTGVWNTQQRMYGTIGYDQAAGRLLFNNQNWTDRAALTLVPFLDANANDTYDSGERVLDAGVLARLDRGQSYHSGQDMNTRFVNLDQYETYRLMIDAAAFEDPVWTSRFSTLDITTDPNQFKTVYLPVYFGCEVLGAVRRVVGDDTTAMHGIRVQIRRLDRVEEEKHVTTWSDGSYAMFGLQPGRYEFAVDLRQVEALGYEAVRSLHEITLISKEYGDIREGVDFLLVASGIRIDETDTLHVERLPDSAVVVLPPIAVADTVREAEEPSLPAEDVFVPVPFGVTQQLPIDLVRPGLDSMMRNWLDRLIRTVSALDEYTIALDGHSDNFGSFQENQQRSDERASRVLDYLLTAGIPRRNIQMQGFGSRRPVATNTTAEGRRRNNRADVTLTATGPSVPPSLPVTPPPLSDDSLAFTPPELPDPATGTLAAAATLLIPGGARSMDDVARRNLSDVLRHIQGDRVYLLQLDGHSDNFGTITETQQRSQERADLVLRHLLENGIPRERIQVQAFGARRPAANNRTAEGRRQNNRVEIRILVW